MDNKKQASVDSIIAATSKTKQTQEYKLGNCSRTLHVGLFFDGVGRNQIIDKPVGKLSNIAKLYDAYNRTDKDTETNVYRKYYISGLGTPYDEVNNSKSNHINENLNDEFQDNIQDSITDTGLEVGLDYAMGKDGFKNIEELVSPKGQIKMLGEAGFDAAAKIGIEATPFLRDNEFIAYNFVTGVETRINDIKERFSRAYKDADKGDVPLNLISVSVFGFDMGATLARYFIGVLVNQLCQKDFVTGLHFYGGIHNGAWVNIPFVGLFDCSRDTPESNDNGLDYGLNALTVTAKSNKVTEVAIGSLITLIAGRKYIDHMTPLPHIVKKSLHLIAAHEKRKWRCLYLTGRSGENHQEELLPGCSEDIGGSLRENEQKPNAELAKVALNRMYLAAYHAGIPFPELDELRETDIDTWLYFWDEKKIKEKMVTEWVDQYQLGMPTKKLSYKALNAHLDSYFSWLGQKHYEYKSELRKLEEQKKSEWVSPGSHLGGFSLTSSSDSSTMSASKKIALLKTNWGWLSEIAIEAGLAVTEKPGGFPPSIMNNIYIPGKMRAQNYIDCGTAGYDGKPCPVPRYPISNELYSWFVHDIQRHEGINYRYFFIRLMEPLSGQFPPDQPEVITPPQPPLYIGNDFIFTGWPKF